MSDRVVIATGCTPKLPRHCKLRFDKPRGQWIILAPERVFELDEIASEIIKLCDGDTALDGVIDTLAAKFDAPRETIASDVTGMLQGLADKGFIVT